MTSDLGSGLSKICRNTTMMAERVQMIGLMVYWVTNQEKLQ